MIFLCEVANFAQHTKQQQTYIKLTKTHIIIAIFDILQNNIW